MKVQPRKKIERNSLNSRKLFSNERFSDTPKKEAHSKTGRNIMDQNNKIINSEVSAVSQFSKKRSSIVSHNVPSNFSISDILGGSWRVFRVSSVYNFNENSLKTYARKLKEEVAAFNCKHENVMYDCSFQFQILPLLGQSYHIIQVLLSANNNKYEGYFISSEKNQYNEASNFKNFPILLVQGRGKILQQVHYTLCKFFDCDISPVRFTFRALITFFASLSEIYVKDIPDLKSEAVILHYKIHGCPESDRIQVAVSLPAASSVFAVFKLQFGNTLSSAQIVSGHYDKIIRHLLNVYQIDLSRAQLSKVIFPGFAVSSEGWVKFASEEMLKETLPIIGQFSQEQHILY